MKTSLRALLSIFTLISSLPLSAYIYPYETPIVKYLVPIEITEFSSGLPPIDCIYVINLDERPEKWQRMQELLEQRNLKVNRVTAVNGWKISDTVRDEVSGAYSKRMKNGHLGCFLSHVSVLRNSFNNHHDCIWIMEDDVDFKEDVSQIPHLLKQLTEIDPEWDVFYTDVDSRTPKGEHIRPYDAKLRPDQPLISLTELNDRTLITPDLMKLGQRYGLYSYVLSKKGIQKLLDYFTHVYLWSPIDVDIHRVPTIREYSITRDIIGIWFASGIKDTERPI